MRMGDAGIVFEVRVSRPRMKRRFWTDADLRTLREAYPYLATEKVAEKLGRTTLAVYGMAEKIGIGKAPGFLQSGEAGRQIRKGWHDGRGKEFRFPKGHEPANKGLRRPGYAPGRMAETQFKPGQRPHTWHPVGAICVDADGYARIKVRERGAGDGGGWDPAVWPLLHRFTWEQLKGPIPARRLVAFKDRDRRNVRLDNLELITLAENARRNRMWNRYPRELALAIQANSALKRQIKRRIGDGKKQDVGPAGSPVRGNRRSQGR